MSQEEVEEVEKEEKKWYVRPWPPLAWVETGIKLLAIVVGVMALIAALLAGVFVLPSGVQLAQWAVLGLMSLGLLAAVIDRWIEREIVAMVFVVLNNLGHWGMVIALATEPGPGALLPLFAGLMLAGDAVKLVFLRLYGLEVRNTPQSVLFGLTSAYVVGYMVLLLLSYVQ